MDLLLENISHSYGPVEVLKDLSLRIPNGQIVCVIGPSGCGKSTLLRFLGGLERPTAGKVLAVGTPPSDSLNPLTYVFQHFALLPGAASKATSDWCLRITRSVARKPSRSSAMCSNGPGSSTSARLCPSSSRAGCVSAWRLPALWRYGRR